MQRVVPFKLLLGSVLFLIYSLPSFSQTTIQGTVWDQRTDKPVANARVYFLLKSTMTNEDGRFLFESPVLEQDVVLTFEKSGYQTRNVHFQLSGQNEIDIGIIPLRPKEDIDQVMGEDFLPLFSHENNQLNGSGAESLSGILTGSSDLFVSTAAHKFGAARFRLRGYDARHTPVYINGVPITNPENGYTDWRSWSGLNDVLRHRQADIGVQSIGYSFGGIGGAAEIDTRATRLRPQVRASFTSANRNYNNRAMLTLSTGTRPSGWAATLSGSRRWADEGFEPGTFYDAWSYFLSISKLFGERHELNLTAFGVPVEQGLRSVAPEQVYELAGSNYYNPDWGYQSGEKRSAHVYRGHQPTVVLRHDWKIGNHSRLTTAASYQLGRTGTTGLAWYDARDPRPDYYQRMPYFIDNPQSQEVADKFGTDPSVSQINWDYLYNVNRNNLMTIPNVDGIPGNDVFGRRAQYLLEEERRDFEQAALQSNLKAYISNKFTLTAGVELQQYRSDNYKLVDDLLDADFFIDIDKFAAQANPGDEGVIQNDLSRPNHLAQRGDTIGYSYRNHLLRGAGWIQADFTFRKVDLFFAATGSTTEFYREGMWQNGRFPNDSKGDSEKQQFFNYGGKGGITFRFGGRNFFQLMGGYLTKAPYLDDAFLSPRTRNQFVPNLESETIISGEGGYQYRGPYANLRLTGYYTRFENQLMHNSFYLDNPEVNPGGMANYIMQGVNTQHFGVEAAAEWMFVPGLRVSGVAAIGQYTYTNRPEVTVLLDHEAEPEQTYTAYLQNFYVANTPQTAVSGGISYNSKDYWFVSFSANYFDEIWMDFNPSRRTTDGIAYGNDGYVEPESDLWREIIFQKKAPAAVTLDFFGGTSIKINKVFLELNAGVNNILDNQNFITGGFEPYRFDFEDKNTGRYPNELNYGWGRTYFVQLGLRL